MRKFRHHFRKKFLKKTTENIFCGLFLNEHFDQFEKRQSEHETHEIQLILKKLEAMEQMEDSEGMRYNMTIFHFGNFRNF